MKKSKIIESVFERFEIVKKEEWYVFKDRKWETYLESGKGTIAFKTHADATKFLTNYFTTRKV